MLDSELFKYLKMCIHIYTFKVLNRQICILIFERLYY